jgi:Uma2 family endonuclease
MNAAETLPVPPHGARLWPLSVTAYRALGEAGLLPKNTELLYGFVCQKMPQSPTHSFLIRFLHDALIKVLPAGALLSIEQPITCIDSEPEPDLSVVKGRKEDFRQDHPHTAELAIEIGVSSHDFDRSKLRAYARAGVKEVWLVLAPERQIEVHRDPAIDRFAAQKTYGLGERLTSVAVPEFTLDLDALFAP